MLSNCYDVDQVMPQQQSRNVLSGTSDESRRTTIGNSSTSYTVERNGLKQRSSGKNKIPKSIRYDLENALVGLCDVWFEEIKPHLVNNNLKLHVPEAGPRPVASASGDYVEQPACSHRDPGAAPDHPQQIVSCADCCVARRTASRGRYRRPRVPSRPPALSPLPSMPISARINKQNQLTNCTEKQKELPDKSRKKLKLYPHSYKRLARGSQANNAPIADKLTKRIVDKRLGDHLDNLYQIFGPRRKLVKKKRIDIANAPMEASGAPTPVTSVNLSAQKPKLCKLIGSRRSKMTPTGPATLFKEELIDIIADRMDKTLRLGDSSAEPFTMMKLYPYNQKSVGVKINPPWK